MKQEEMIEIKRVEFGDNPPTIWIEGDHVANATWNNVKTLRARKGTQYRICQSSGLGETRRGPWRKA